MIVQINGLSGIDGDGQSARRAHLALCAELRQQILARPRAAADAFELLGNELDRARLANALGDSKQFGESLQEAAGLAAALTIRERLRSGNVELVSRYGEVLSFPAGATKAAPPSWLDGLACAIITRDVEACACLANTVALDCVAAAARDHARPIGAEPFWADYGRAFIALLEGRPDSAAYAQRARQQIQAGPMGALIREGLLETDVPVLDLIEIVASGALTEWPLALDKALLRFDAHFSRDDNADNLWGFLPLGILAVCSLAVQRGFTMPASSPYLPAELLAGQSAAAHSGLTVRYSRRSILSADEAHWFFDLQGFARQERTHRLIQQDGLLVARYEVGAAAGLPPATGEFVVLEDCTTAPPVACAVDAGELLFLAQTFSSRISADGVATAAERMLLKDAIACVDAALARVPPGAEVVPPDTLVSRESREILDSEPRRFSRTRLDAYRAGLVSVLEKVAPKSPDTPAVADAALALIQNAQVSIELIRQQALSVLEAIAKDNDGSFIATLKPGDDDYARAFLGEAADRAQAAYAPMWAEGMPRQIPRPSQSEIRCDVSPAGMFAWDNELSRRFPGGYQAIAKMLNPHCVWLAWRYVEPGQVSGLSFDGLVWLVDRWVWFPKPYRALRRNLAP